MYYYTLSDFQDISTKGFNVILPDTTVELINNLSSLVGSPNYIKTPVFSKKETVHDNDKRKKKEKFGRRSADTSTWLDKNKKSASDTTSSNIVFKTPTIMKKDLSIVETYVKKIRTILNKVATNSDIDLLTPLTDTLDEMLETDITGEEVNELSENVTRIMSTNSFYSDDYSRIYALLLKRYEFIREVFMSQSVKYLHSYNEVKDINPDENYDLFCEINKSNDFRRSTTLFFTNLYFKHEMFEKDQVLELIHDIVDNLYKNINNKDSIYLNDEIIENICIFIQNENSDLFQLCEQIYIDNNLNIQDFIVKISSSKPKQYGGLSTKSLFKLMDTVENIKKNM